MLVIIKSTTYKFQINIKLTYHFILRIRIGRNCICNDESYDPGDQEELKAAPSTTPCNWLFNYDNYLFTGDEAPSSYKNSNYYNYA